MAKRQRLSCGSAAVVASQALPVPVEVGGCIELAPGHMKNAAALYCALKAVTGIVKVRWLERGSEMPCYANLFIDRRVQVYSDVKPSVAMEFAIARRNVSMKGKSLTTMLVFFTVPPATLRLEAWRILLDVCAGKELDPEYVTDYSMTCIRNVARGDTGKPLPPSVKPLALYCIQTGFMDMVEETCRKKKECRGTTWTEGTERGFIEVPRFLVPKRDEGRVLFSDGELADQYERHRLLRKDVVCIIPGIFDYAAVVGWIVSVSQPTQLHKLKSWLPSLSAGCIAGMVEHTLSELRFASKKGAREYEQIRSFEDVAMHLWAKSPDDLNMAFALKERSPMGGSFVIDEEPGVASSSVAHAPVSVWSKSQPSDSTGFTDADCHPVARALSERRKEFIAAVEEVFPEMIRATPMDTFGSVDRMEAMKAMKQRAVEHVRFRVVADFVPAAMKVSAMYAMREEGFLYLQRQQKAEVDTKVLIPDLWEINDDSTMRPFDFIVHASARSLDIIAMKNSDTLQMMYQPLLSSLPASSVCKMGLDLMETLEGRAKAIAGLVNHHSGEVVELDRARTTWHLRQGLPSGFGGEEFHAQQLWCKPGGSPVGELTVPAGKDEYGRSWAQAAEGSMKRQTHIVVSQIRNIVPAALLPCWENQVSRLIAPCRSVDDWQWYRAGPVITLGELFIALGKQFTADDIYSFYRTLRVVVLKRQKDVVLNAQI